MSLQYQLIQPRNPELTPIEQIFANRGIIGRENINHYLHTTKEDLIAPDRLINMREGTAMLMKHIKAQDKVLIQVDSDCDGYTSAALLINYLNSLFPAYVQNYITYRVHDDKSHGIKFDTIPTDVKLVIAPDSSSNDYEVHKQLAERDCDVLVIDHHLADHISEYACVINNQMCDYPTKALSGAGVVYKFCCYLDSLLDIDYANNFIDLAAVGMIADIMDLSSYEVRYIVEQGLQNVTNPFIKEMMKKQEYKIQGTLNPFKVAFYIAPFINAVNRSGNADERLLLFESMLTFRAYEQIPSTKRGCKGMTETRVEQAVRTCGNVKTHQEKDRDINQAIVERIIADKTLYDHVLIAVKLPKDKAADKNLTGLIATRIANYWGRPTAILNEVVRDGVTYWEGSMRGAPHIPITDTRQMFLDSGLVEYCEGHANAGGVSIKDENFTKLIDYLDEKYADVSFESCYFVDLEMRRTDENLEQTILDIGALNDYWGQGVEEPLIAITNVNVTANNVDLYRANTLHIGFGDLSFIKFKASDEEYSNLHDTMGGHELTIIGHCHINDYGGYQKPQIEIVDYYITKHWPYYF